MQGSVRHSHAEIHMMASDNQEQAMNDKTVVNVVFECVCVCASSQMLLFQMVGYVMFRVARLLVLCQILCLLRAVLIIICLSVCIISLCASVSLLGVCVVLCMFLCANVKVYVAKKWVAYNLTLLR